MLEKILESPRRFNQSILKEISPEYSLEGLILKLHYFGHLMRRNSSLLKTLILGKIEGRRRKEMTEGEIMNGNTNSMGYEFELTLGDGEGQGSLACCSPWICRVGRDLASEHDLAT